MVDEHHLSRVRACQAVGLPRSALYKPTTDRAAKDAPVIDAINVMLEKRPRWGFWKCFDRLRQDGHGWNHKRVYRVYCAMRLNLKRKVRRRVLTRERQPLLASSELNRVWALDFMRDTLYDGSPFRTLNVITRATGRRCASNAARRSPRRAWFACWSNWWRCSGGLRRSASITAPS